DLLAERLDLVALALQGRGELLVLRKRARQIGLRLQELVLEDLDLPRSVREPPPEEGDLVLEEPHLGLELVDLLLVALLLLARIRPGHHVTSRVRASIRRPPPAPGSAREVALITVIRTLRGRRSVGPERRSVPRHDLGSPVSARPEDGSIEDGAAPLSARPGRAGRA